MATLTEKVNQLKCDVVTAARLVDFWEKQIQQYGASRAEGFYLSLGLNHIERKGIEWEGLKLSREPKEHEKVAVKGIAQAQESGKEAISKILLSLRDELIEVGLKGITKLKPATYHELTLQAPKEFRSTLRERLIQVYQHGTRLVALELGGQGQGLKATSEDEFDDLDDLVDVALSRTVNDVQSRIIVTATEGFTLGLTGNDLQSMIQTTVNTGSVTYIDRTAGGLSHRVIGIGRRDEMRNRSDDIDRYEYSALLDVNTCGPCASLDGTTAQNMDELPEVPLVDCEGGSMCRCFIVAIAD